MKQKPALYEESLEFEEYNEFPDELFDDDKDYKEFCEQSSVNNKSTVSIAGSDSFTPERLAYLSDASEFRSIHDEESFRLAVTYGGSVILYNDIILRDNNPIVITKDVVIMAESVHDGEDTLHTAQLHRGVQSGYMFDVKAPAKLTILHVVISSDNAGSLPLFNVDEGAALELSAGAQVMNSASGVVINNGTCDIKYCTFRDNNSSSSVAAIMNYNVLNIISSVFTDNSCQHNGGVINNLAGNVTIQSSSFKNNRAEYGGAIYNSASLTFIENDEPIAFFNNTANFDGGAVYMDEASNGVRFTPNCSFIFNAAGNGGAIYPSKIGMLAVAPGALFANNSANFVYKPDENNIAFYYKDYPRRIRAERWNADYRYGINNADIAFTAFGAEVSRKISIPGLAAQKAGEGYISGAGISYTLYDGDGNALGITTVEEDGTIRIPPLLVDEKSSCEPITFTLSEFQKRRNGFVQNESLRILVTVSCGVVESIRFLDGNTFAERAPGDPPYRCCEPESYDAYPCEPPDLVDGESIFLPVMRKWEW